MRVRYSLRLVAPETRCRLAPLSETLASMHVSWRALRTWGRVLRFDLRYRPTHGSAARLRVS